MWSEAEDERERFVDRAKLARGETARRSSESLGVHDSRLFDEDAGFLPLQRDRRAEACWKRMRGGRRDERRAEVEEFVGLDDDCEPCSSLLVSADRTRSGKPKHVSADQVSETGPVRGRPFVRARFASVRGPSRRPRHGGPPRGAPSERGVVPLLREGQYAQPQSPRDRPRAQSRAQPPPSRRAERGEIAPPRECSTKRATTLKVIL